MSSPPPRPCLRQSLPCDLARVRQAARATCKFLAANGCSASDLIDIELALVEACNNAIQYAAAETRHIPVLIEATCLAEAYELRIIDHTPGFEWPERAILPGTDCEHGRGLYLIRAVMDYAEYSRGPGQNTLLLRRKPHP